jgi:precorrin-6B C5,15-methyltransferase / cobalt-precorrin-6B C5,C15-methyltransferase
VMETKSQGAWLSIVGIGEDGWDGLRAEAKQAIASADLLFGGARHLAHVPETAGKAARSVWPSPMAPAIQEILEQHRGWRQIVVLGSGDPMLYGVGVTLTRELDFGEFRVIPQVSAFSLACARLGWPATEALLISLVNRPVEQILRHLVPEQKLVLYSENGSTPAIVARLLQESGYGKSRLHVFENLDGKTERHRTELAAAWPAEASGPLNVIALICEADAGVTPLSLVPGLPDDAFESDGQLTKREVRSATLARLAPLPRQTLWDVGAGTGTIGIEWMRTHSSCRCVTFEARPDRAARILTNARRLGVPSLKVVEGPAPESFANLPSPHAIFLGGGVSSKGLFEACWERLAPGGRLVANAVTLESEASLIAWHTLHGGDLARIQIARAEPIGSSYGWRQMMPITQWAVRKP